MDTFDILGSPMERDEDGFVFPAGMPPWQRELAKGFLRHSNAQAVIVNLPREMGRTASPLESLAAGLHVIKA